MYIIEAGYSYPQNLGGLSTHHYMSMQGTSSQETKRNFDLAVDIHTTLQEKEVRFLSNG